MDFFTNYKNYLEKKQKIWQSTNDLFLDLEKTKKNENAKLHSAKGLSENGGVRAEEKYLAQVRYERKKQEISQQANDELQKAGAEKNKEDGKNLKNKQNNGLIFDKNSLIKILGGF